MLDICVVLRYINQVGSEPTKYGGIAQLGERLNGIQEVSGSIPLISTIEALKTVGFQGFLLFWVYMKSSPDVPLYRDIWR